MFGSHKETFLSELGWREFSYHLLYHFPKINKQNLKEQFNKLDWNVNDELLLKCFQRLNISFWLKSEK